jgi:alanyl-tRNA synthetase
MNSYEVRKKFLDHFEQNDHQLFKSSSLIPLDDPTLLFNNAGMNQFKGVFTGEQHPPKSKKATSSQKCVRAGGKHNDLDNVGFTARHHTFFEMLGNFSFGDYFKVGAIEMAWELLTKKYNLDPKKLYVTVYEDDDEAADIWKKHIGIPSDKIYRFGQKDNFWRMGDTGPCGPCSEIFYDQGEHVGGDPRQNVMGGDGDRFIEIWNLVFMQFYEDEFGKLNPLPKPSIDTGMGLERISSILQGQTNNYNTDLFLPLIEVASRISKTNYSLSMPTNDKTAAALRVIADHSRAVSFLLADGVIPSNEGRGYVLRRILRRAVRYARTLTEDSVFPEVCKQVIITMDDFYPELSQSKDFILQTVKDEQDRFLETLDKGTELLSNEIGKVKSKNAKKIDGEFVFKLYDTFGFPSDLTQLMAQEQGLEIDEIGFNEQLNTAKEKSKAVKNVKSYSVNNSDLINKIHNLDKTVFVGYSQLNTASSVIKKILIQENNILKDVTEIKEGHTGFIIFDETPFYAEGGGQSADVGVGFKNETASSPRFDVVDVQKYNDIFVHTIEVQSGTFKVSDKINLHVDKTIRSLTASNHSATHLLHYALREELGVHVKQAGSLVNSEKLRFDFTNKGPLSEEQIHKIEHTVNSMIQKAIEVQFENKSYTQAVKDGALALFGEKYEDEVRVISMGSSIELCGGTHVNNISQIKYFKIISESGVSSGVRRIEALTDYNAINYLNEQFEDFKSIKNLVQLPVQANRELVAQQIQKYKNEIAELKKEVKSKATSAFSIEDAFKATVKLNADMSYLVCTTEMTDASLLRDTADRLKDKMSNGVVVVIGAVADKTPLLVSVTKALSAKIPAGQILKQITAELGGSGGGRPDMAQGAITNPGNFVEVATKIVEKQMGSVL